MATTEDHRAELRLKARVCIAAGMQPSEYDRLTSDELAAFLDVIDEQAKRT